LAVTDNVHIMLSYWAQTYIKHEGTCPPPNTWISGNAVPIQLLHPFL